ncbi:MAG: polymorphic toxin-type HINT domain-containing protein [Oscillospiraceae bacterium]|uniref:polymorphic toxin-type HINT domain-containing protein n=1 Tax=Faecousia sp. TaxID=2952921 RepID=UPI003A16645E
MKVYNFQVADYHTYYVSDNGVLVHNKCGGETAAARRGRQMHKEWDYGSGVIKEKVIGKGARVDGIDYVNRIVYELKPNNPRAVRRGLAQLDRYLNILGAEDWAGVLVLYD